MGKLRPYVSRCDEHAMERYSVAAEQRRCARPTGCSHGRTTDACAQRFKGAERRPRPRGEIRKARPIVRPGVKPMWGHRSIPGLRQQALLYVASKVSASAMATYTHDN